MTEMLSVLVLLLALILAVMVMLVRPMERIISGGRRKGRGGSRGHLGDDIKQRDKSNEP